MVKFNNRNFSNGSEENIESIDWAKLLGSFQNQSVPELLENIMNKIITTENVEFDQICLILKHYLVLETENFVYLNHFLTHDQGRYINLLVERFENSPSPNLKWMITEIFKLVSSACDNQQAGYLLAGEKFQGFLLKIVFDSSLNIHEKLVTSSGLSNVETAIVTNIIETITNLCEIRKDLISCVSPSHIEWLATALLQINHIHEHLIIAIARLFHLFSEYSINEKEKATKLTEYLTDLYINKNFFLNLQQHLQSKEENPCSISNNLNARLLIIVSLVNLILANDNFETQLNLKKSDSLLKVMNDYGNFIEYSLSIEIRENENTNKQNQENSNQEESNEQDLSDSKRILNLMEQSIDSKLMSIDLIKLIAGYFIKDESDEEEWEECDDNTEETDNNNNVEMDQEEAIESKNSTIDPNQLNVLKQLITKHKLMSLLIKTICRDNENCYQDNDRIDHIYNSIKFLRNEALKIYLELIENFFIKDQESIDVEPDHLITLLQLVSSKPIEDLELEGQDQENRVDKYEQLTKLIDLSFDLFMFFNNKNTPSLDLNKKSVIVSSIKDILIKYQTNIIEACVKLARILGLIAIKERSNQQEEAKLVMQASTTILIELTAASFELVDQSKIESLRLNAELIDLIIDVFGEDNLGDLEKSLNFIARIKDFSDKFYTKFNRLVSGKKLKLNKDHSVIIKTVKDNLKAFVDYKIKNTK